MSGTSPGPVAHVPLAYFFGEDTYGIERAVRDLARVLGDETGSLVVAWMDVDEEVRGGPGSTGAGSGAATRILDRLEQQLGTAPLFGGGTLVAVRQPAPLLRATASRTRTIALTSAVPPGNGLCFCEFVERRAGKTTEPLRRAVAAAGGEVRELPALTRERMEGWLDRRSIELGVRLGPGAARLLAERVGAYVREGDVDRRGQSALANAELEKLALYRPGGAVGREDVAELVAEAVPGSTWAFLDALATRRGKPAAELFGRLVAGGTPFPVLLTQLHRRLRELVQVRELLGTGTRASDLVRIMRLQPYRAQRLAEQASSWTLDELERALEGLLEVDLLAKGISADGTASGISEERAALALEVWLTEQVAPSVAAGARRRDGGEREG